METKMFVSACLITYFCLSVCLLFIDFTCTTWQPGTWPCIFWASWRDTPVLNNTSWRRNACTTCYCSDGITTCNSVKCKDPQCNTAQGQAMAIPSNRCCPVCTNSRKNHCVSNGKVLAHDTEWEADNCTQCRCDNGAIVCSLKRCERPQCGYGETLRHVPGHCCPKCVSTEDSCHSGGQTYRDGETWNPSLCERATCADGELIRSVAHCENIVCLHNEEAVVLKGRCCPTCEGRSCIYKGREYASGEQFKDGTCRHCICRSGEVTCKHHYCNSTASQLDVGCPAGERIETREDSCCPECVSTHGQCEYQGRRYYHGDLWNITKCEVAICSHGNVRSSIVQCSPVVCKLNEKLVHHACCPECVPVTSSCHHAGFEYRNGDVWKGGLCKTCECSNGTVQCFTADCPICPPRTVPVSIPGECCPDCQPVACHSDCLTCSAPGYGHCLSCPPDRFLQNGKCVRRCRIGFYENGKLCRACHSTCSGCTLGNSPSACTSCNSGMLLQLGRCVPSCEIGFFRIGSNCRACPKGCQSCLNSTQCLSCVDRTQLPQGGACVRQCSAGHFQDKDLCKACHPSCSTCTETRSHCLTCADGKLLEEKRCVGRCSPGYFQISISRCSACHMSCATCTGLSSDQCQSCPKDKYLYSGKCIDVCPPRHYQANGQCRACHSTCIACTGPLPTDCTKCLSSNQVVQPDGRGSLHGSCQASCSDGFYYDGSLCRACSSQCSRCNGPRSCLACKEQYVLLPGTTLLSSEHCISVQNCINKGFTLNTSSLLCYNSTALTKCARKGQYLVAADADCSSKCPSGTFSKEISTSTMCIGCGENCSSCTHANHCLTCTTGKHLSQITNTCVDMCETGYYAWRGKCLKCPEGCASCKASSMTSSQALCTSCMEADAVLQHGECTTYCVQQFYADRKAGNMGTPVCRECDWSCTACSGPQPHQCLECMDGHKIQNGSCVPECTQGFYASSHRCLPCRDENCQSCSRANQCTKCKPSYFQHVGKCVRACPRGFFADANSCVSCPAHCLVCSSSSNCTQCDDKTYSIMDDLDESSNSQQLNSRRAETNRHVETCVRHCGHGYTANRHTRICQANRHAPEITISGSLLPGFGSRVLVNTLKIIDQDTASDDIYLSITMQPSNGWFEMNRTKIPAESQFSYQKVLQGNLWFVHDNTKRRHSVASFQAFDGSLHSQVATLEILAVPQHSPVITKNNLLILRVGETAKISSRFCFNVSYSGGDTNLKFNLLYQPKYGKVVKLPRYGTTISGFKMADLNSDVILYVSNGNMTSPEAHFDSLFVQVTDGYHVINKVININILPKGNSSNLILSSKGTRVRKGGMTRITNQHLLTIASNVKDKSNIVYVIRPKKGERSGKLVLMVPEMSDAPVNYGIGITEWTRTRGGQYQSPPVVRFSQRDVDDGYIWYKDQGRNINGNTESFQYEVYDDSSLSSKPLGGSTFQVTRIHDNLQPPHLSPGISAPLQMSANEGMTSVLHSGYLRFTDQDTPDRDILYNITRPLPPSYGQIESEDRPDVPITMFTQSDIDANKIIYRPPVGGLPSIRQRMHQRRNNRYSGYAPQNALSSTNKKGDSKLLFEFTVSDGQHTLPATNFTINLMSSSTAPPVLSNHLSILDVARGGTATIGAVQLTVTDHDTPLSELIFTLIKPPRFGKVIRNDYGSRDVLVVGDTFTNAQIRRGSIHYTHNGERNRPTDHIQISITDGTHTIVAFIQVSILQTGASLAPSADPFSELSIVVEESSEAALTRENLAFVDADSEDSQIVYHVESEALHGVFKKGTEPLVPGSTFTQQDINLQRINYVSRPDIGNFPLKDNVRFHVTDSVGNVLPNQALNITITPIRRQRPPVIAVGDPIVVGSGKEVRITTENILISDADTASHDLIVSVLTKPLRGIIMNKRSEELLMVHRNEDIQFTVSDLSEGYIYYAHSRDLGGAQDQFTIRVGDGHSVSHAEPINILIEESSHIRPIVQTTPVTCQNGHAIIIKSNTLSVMDRDTPNRDLILRLTHPLLLGKLVKFKERLPHDMLNGWKLGMMAGKMKKKQTTELFPGDSFTYQDILDQLICYENTVAEPNPPRRGLRRRRETVGMILSDGTSHQQLDMVIEMHPEGGLRFESPPRNLPPNYFPADPIHEHVGNEELRGTEREEGLDLKKPEDEDMQYPDVEVDEMRRSELVLEANTGMTVEQGSVTVITSKELRVTGTDHTITYVITRDPNVGTLQYAERDLLTNLSAMGDNEFTQQEIDEGKIRYFHPASQGGGDVFFMFDIIGGKVDLRFNIHVNEDRHPPKIVVNRGLTVREGGSKKITTHQLSARDDESSRLVFDVMQPVRLGRLEYVNAPGRAIGRFTQSDLISETIQYVHTADSKKTEDHFSFSLTDGANSVVQTFVIRVELIDNSLPILENHGVRVQEGVRKTINEFELKATDRDTDNDLVRFDVIEPPQHGTIDRSTDGRRYVHVKSFTMDDVYESRISYNHDGTNSLTDSFSFKVSDGTNNEFVVVNQGTTVTTTLPQLFHIEVVPVDDGTPRLLTNLGLNSLEYQKNETIGKISKRFLLTEDPDTEPNRIVYTITSDPRHGHVESTANIGQRIRSFTQADINSDRIRYVLSSNAGTSVTRDSFMFNVRDSLPNVVTGNTFNIRWSVISFDKTNYTVNEETGTIDIPVMRKGNLNQYAIVLCRTKQGTATSVTSANSRSSGQMDYTEHAVQVQFEVYETEKMCSIQINDDSVFEGTESFSVELTMPTDALLGNITSAYVFINDEKDTPTIQFIETQYTVEERDTVVFVPIKRTGDVEKPVSVVCYTESKSASGSIQGRIGSGSDYKSRDHRSRESVVAFAPGVSQANCDVKIIDDSLYEDSEEFTVKIALPSEKAKIGKFAEATVTITGPNDSPTVFLTDSKFEFAETAGTVDIPVHRRGSDLSLSTDVWCSTRQSDPVSAVAGEDFLATSTKITFRPDETAKICSLSILDDSQTPVVEGNETFVVYLNSVQKARLTPPHEALVIINDTLDDVPKFQFAEATVEVEENSGVVSLPIKRVGDVSGRASVICYTRQNTALVEEDFVERPRTEMSRIVFNRGQRMAHCNVTLIDDGAYEASETFTVRLGDATGEKWYGARVGDNDRVSVTVTNDEDAPTLQFELSEYSIREPDSTDSTRLLTVSVVRSGDPSEVSKVRCSTRDGSAKSGSDYEPKSRLLRFQPGETAVSFEVNILSNEDTEWHETFLIVLGPQEPVNAVLGEKFQTTITILDKDAAGSLVLPSTPVVVSLLHYDDVKLGLKSNPSPGYPIICVTPCDPKYPNYAETRNLCEEAAINASAIRFNWEVAMPSDEENSVPPFETITDATPFTSVNTKVLDSIYFGRRFHVRCVAQAVDSVTHTGGTPLRSNVVTIATDSGLCHNPIKSGSSRNFQAQSFIANLNYISDERDHPNTLHISVKIPHQDGRLPLISTMPLNNLKLLLSRSIDRQQHVCSNLVYSEKKNKTITISGETAPELGTGLGFIQPTDYSKLSLGPGYDKPYQFDPSVRERKTIDLYKYLNLKSCIWQFDAYYHMNELIDYCNGKVESDFQLRDSAESQVTVTVPLHVSYVFVTAPRGWGALEHETEMEVAFRYNNVLWRTGIQTDGVLSGRIQVEKIKIREDGKLLIEFKTQAKFRGLFVMAHRTLPTKKARIVPPEGMNIAFELTQLWSERTFDSPYQRWQAVSTYSRKDYSGEYTVELLPCTVSPTQKWKETPTRQAIPCTASAPEKFKIPIMFQQTNRPVPVVYTLQTDFQLCNNEKVFMMDPNKYEQEMNEYDYKGSFTKGQTIFGRVLWTPEQDLKSAYRLQLDKVYLCTGKDGYVPYFDPTGEVYGKGPQHGCIKPSKNLQHRFLLLDRSNRDAEDRYFHDVSFDAHFASDRPEFAGMAELPGVDGFCLKVDALYKVEAGHQWYIQVLYAIGSESSLPRGRRSVMFDASSGKILNRRRRSDTSGQASEKNSNTGWRDDEKSHNGTNMRGININQSELSDTTPLIVGVSLAAVVLIGSIAFALCCCICGGRRKAKQKERDIEMVARKTAALEEDDTDDDDLSTNQSYSKAKVITLDKNQVAARNNRADVNCSQSLLSPKQRSRHDKANNVRDAHRPLLKHDRRKNVDLKFSNNLKEANDQGTEV